MLAGTYAATVHAGIVKSNMHWGKIFLLGMSSGFFLSFGGFLMYVVGGTIPGVADSNPGLKKLLQGLVFPVGLLLVIINGAELYTGNTATLACAFFELKIPITGLLKNWWAS